MKFFWLVVLAGLSPVMQVLADTPGRIIQVPDGLGGTLSIDTGAPRTDVTVDGVAVINGEVFVDGEKTPRGKKTVVSKKTGKIYRIDWGKNGNVSVSEQ